MIADETDTHRRSLSLEKKEINIFFLFLMGLLI